MEVINKHRNKLIILGVIIEIILIPLILINVVSLKNKNDDNNISSINEIGKQEFGIMYRDNDTDSYKTYSGSIVDAINNSYELNLTNSKCSDGSGATVTPSSVLSINGSTVTIKSNKTVYCTLYFDYNRTIRILRENDPNNTLSKDIVGDMYRYQAAIASTNINDTQKKNEFINNLHNYICFGTTENCGTSDELIDKYMYRIIGVTKDGRLKLIKETFIYEDDDRSYEFTWSPRYMIPNGRENLLESIARMLCNDGGRFVCATWPKSDMFNRLNGNKNGSTNGPGIFTGDTASGYVGDTDIFVDNPKYEYLKSGDGKNGGTSASTWYNLIEDHEWMYGDIGSNKFDAVVGTLSGDTLYSIETGASSVNHYVGTSAGVYLPDGRVSIEKDVHDESYKWSEIVDAKIGLPYIHDLFYTYPNGKILGDVDGYDGIQLGINTQNISWILLLSPEFLGVNTLIDRFGLCDLESPYYCYNTIILSNTILVFNATVFQDPWSVRPVFYLNSSVKLSGTGNGTQTNPFILDVK